MAHKKNNDDNQEEPVIRDKRRVDPETGNVREPADAGDGTDGVDASASAPAAGTDGAAADDDTEDGAELTDADQVLLDQAATDLVAEMRSDMLRAQAELVNFRTRVERDRALNRDAVIAEVIRSLLPALDDLALAETHGDLKDGAPLTIVAQKIRGAFEKYGLKQVGVKGEPFDPAFHEAVVQLPNPEVTVNTIGDVISAGYVLGDRLVRPAKVAVFVPAE
ncbi:nucleotide exchange factor GrpE [Salinibacterium sp. G-O1]|uniref:nucleotide exchange factor GrpE n=1 Tax=Salinibacterium sp. G-O1 TaxID=3046208 RepID=UPI0024BB6434|nr:nucleotide exchange factor GrpE [Salinibacterium sp. G-O1]MDJ0333752.1 nucleotide exchange factor GrpE [Salinibacterium sp. G-O1]